MKTLSTQYEKREVWSKDKQHRGGGGPVKSGV